jgi:chemotaxis protein methyltransferase CheR
LLQAPCAAEVKRQVVEAMTTNETYFFRDPAQYDAIRTVLLPRLIEERRQTRKMRFWSAAASTGQEAYSLAMLLNAQGLDKWNVQILGTDFSTQVLERARSGKFQQIEVNRGLPAAMLVKHFRQVGVDWELSEAVRRMVNFESIDLRDSMRSLGPFDLVFCRNVMIYFDAKTKRNILKEIHGTMFRGAWLLLGGVETAFGVEEWFERQTIGNASVYIAR